MDITNTTATPSIQKLLAAIIALDHSDWEQQSSLTTSSILTAEPTGVCVDVEIASEKQEKLLCTGETINRNKTCFYKTLPS